MKPNIVDQYVKTGKVRFQFQDFPFIGNNHNPNESLLAAQAADCAANQNKFWLYHDTLYENQPPENSGKVTTGYLKNVAKTVGLDTNQFDQCLDSHATADHVQQELSQAQQLGLTGTPTVFVNGQKLSSATWDSVKAAIDAALAKK